MPGVTSKKSDIKVVQKPRRFTEKESRIRDERERREAGLPPRPNRWYEPIR